MNTYRQLLCVGITRYPRAVWDTETSVYVKVSSERENAIFAVQAERRESVSKN